MLCSFSTGVLRDKGAQATWLSNSEVKPSTTPSEFLSQPDLVAAKLQQGRELGLEEVVQNRRYGAAIRLHGEDAFTGRFDLAAHRDSPDFSPFP